MNRDHVNHNYGGLTRFKFSTSLSSFEGHPLQVRHKQDWDRGFIPLLPQTAALPELESDAGSAVIKPASSFIMQNRQTSCGVRCIGHAVVHGLRFAQRRHTRNSVKERNPICAWTNGIAQYQPQAVELNPSYSG